MLTHLTELALFKKKLGMRIEKIGVLVEYAVSLYEDCVLVIYNGVGLFAQKTNCTNTTILFLDIYI